MPATSSPPAHSPMSQMVWMEGLGGARLLLSLRRSPSASAGLVTKHSSLSCHETTCSFVELVTLLRHTRL
jgi:hypothetical protein